MTCQEKFFHRSKLFLAQQTKLFLSLCFSLPLCFLLLCAIKGPEARAAGSPLAVIVSIAPQKYILERLAGKRVSVTVLVRAGSDPHSYEPGPAQMRACASAAVWFTIGVPFEDVWLPRIRDAAGDLRVVSSIAGIRRLPFAAAHGDEGHEGHAGEEDPHVWLSPPLLRQMLPAVAGELAGLLPEHAEEVQANAEAFAAELAALDREIAERFVPFAPEQKIFLTFHPSWRYFAHQYGLTELSIETDGKEPGPKRMKALIDTAKAHKIRAIFVEPQFPKASARAIAANIGADVIALDPLAENLPALYREAAERLAASFRN